jgi:diacylglycerol kinase (ATP)
VYWLLAGNTRSYGGLVQITRRARLDDRLLDVAIMHRGGVLRLLTDGVRVLRGRLDRSENVDEMQVPLLSIGTPGLPVQLDGEAFGETPLQLEAVPRALDVIVPAGLASPLWSDPPAPPASGG